MTRTYKLYQVDAFTTDRFLGNPAGVVPNADGLTDEEMQIIARELNNSETAFLFSPSDDDHDIYTRYFTPTHEVPICGHATIASQYILATEQKMDNVKIYNKTGEGILPVDIINENSNYRIAMTQGQVRFGTILDGELRNRLITALRINEDDVIDNFSIQIVSTGHSKVMVGLKSTELLNSLNPNLAELAELSRIINCNGYYIFTLHDIEDEFLVQGRMFAPAIGINEDPVTGNANGPLGAYLVKYNLVNHDGKNLKFKALQGVTMKRPGTIEVQVKIENSQPVEVKVIGTAVIAFKSELEM